MSSFPTREINITLLHSSELLFINILHYGKVGKSHYFLLKIFLSLAVNSVLCYAKGRSQEESWNFSIWTSNKKQEETLSK